MPGVSIWWHHFMTMRSEYRSGPCSASRYSYRKSPFREFDCTWRWSKCIAGGSIVGETSGFNVYLAPWHFLLVSSSTLDHWKADLPLGNMPWIEGTQSFWTHVLSVIHEGHIIIIRLLTIRPSIEKLNVERLILRIAHGSVINLDTPDYDPYRWDILPYRFDLERQSLSKRSFSRSFVVVSSTSIHDNDIPAIERFKSTLRPENIECKTIHAFSMAFVTIQSTLVYWECSPPIDSVAPKDHRSPGLHAATFLFDTYGQDQSDRDGWSANQRSSFFMC